MLVSCIMPTADRRKFVERSIRQFCNQDYEEVELLILDGGKDDVRDLTYGIDRIRYFHAPEMSVGEKRNFLCGAARGDIILFWDDDDLYAPWRITYQVGKLMECGAPISGLDRVLFRDEDSGSMWLYKWPEGRGPFVHGATMAFWKDFWRRYPFHPINAVEDLPFIFTAMAQPMAPQVLERTEMYVGSMHGDNVSGKNTNSPNWSRTAMMPVWATRVLRGWR